MEALTLAGKVMSLVLIADPDRTLATAYRVALERAGFGVETAASGLECLSGLRAFRPLVLVLEPDLPWGSGEGVLALMEEGSAPRVPVLLLSSRPEGGIQRSLHVPVWGRLLKPLEPRRLVGIVSEIACCGKNASQQPRP